MKELKWQCCFCGEGIPPAEELSIVIWMETSDESEQQLAAHRHCLSEKLHPSVPLGFLSS
jgi:hypothetical protein